ncbi:MAG: transglutaminase family protein [Candidatus Pelagadaptatus aseana]|uniref:transglutaminase family protein n=1 Tax=Candidatus Pelagadaptatus aseana TaxID=3120508 RepID=UPI0039B22BF0
MRYKIRHITEYLYADRVSHCYNVAHMIPRNSHRQTCLHNRVTVNPATAVASKRQDYFGNTAYHFEIQRAHNKLVITAESEVETAMQQASDALDFGVTCREASLELGHSKDPQILLSREFLFDSPMVRISEDIRAYAEASFDQDKSLLAAVMDLTSRIYRDFDYSPEATDVATPLEDAFAERRGVCQDFAHVQIACLRAMGFPAIYVSGYLETLPPPGKEKLIGADATHAWIAVFSPREGWVEFDPTNNSLASDQHIVTAWGRDYMDVTPLKGVIYGGGSEPILNVSVDVSRQE